MKVSHVLRQPTRASLDEVKASAMFEACRRQQPLAITFDPVNAMYSHMPIEEAKSLPLIVVEVVEPGIDLTAVHATKDKVARARSLERVNRRHEPIAPPKLPDWRVVLFFAVVFVVGAYLRGIL